MEQILQSLWKKFSRFSEIISRGVWEKIFTIPCSTSSLEFLEEMLQFLGELLKVKFYRFTGINPLELLGEIFQHF